MQDKNSGKNLKASANPLGFVSFTGKLDSFVESLDLDVVFSGANIILFKPAVSLT